MHREEKESACKWFQYQRLQWLHKWPEQDREQGGFGGEPRSEFCPGGTQFASGFKPNKISRLSQGAELIKQDHYLKHCNNLPILKSSLYNRIESIKCNLIELNGNKEKAGVMLNLGSCKLQPPHLMAQMEAQIDKLLISLLISLLYQSSYRISIYRLAWAIENPGLLR